MIPELWEPPPGWEKRNGRITLVAYSPEIDHAKAVWLSQSFLDQVARHHPKRRQYELAYNAVPTLRCPVAIWRGIRDRSGSGNPDWGIAYLGLPEFKYDNNGNQLVP